jgi:hypothetical protein
MSESTWNTFLNYLDRTGFCTHISLQGHLDRDSSFITKLSQITRIYSKPHPGWIDIHWQYVNKDIIHALGEKIRMRIRFGASSFANFSMDTKLISLLSFLTLKGKKYTLNLRVVEGELTPEEIIAKTIETKSKMREILKSHGLKNADTLVDLLGIDVCLPGKSAVVWNKIISVQSCKDELDIASKHDATLPEYKDIDTSVCSSPTLVLYISHIGDLSRCCLDYSVRRVEGNIHTTRPEDLFKGVEYCTYSPKCYEKM